MKPYFQLTINEKLCLKSEAMKLYGKRIHYSRPDYLARLNELHLITLLSPYKQEGDEPFPFYKSKV